MWVRQRNHWRRSQAVVTALQRAPYAFKDHLANLGTPTPPISHTHTHNITHQYHTHTRTISPTNITHTHTHTISPTNITHPHTHTHPHTTHHNPLHRSFSCTRTPFITPLGLVRKRRTGLLGLIRLRLILGVTFWSRYTHTHTHTQNNNRRTEQQQKNRTTDNILTIHPLTTIVALTTQYIYLNNSPPCQPS